MIRNDCVLFARRSMLSSAPYMDYLKNKAQFIYKISNGEWRWLLEA